MNTICAFLCVRDGKDFIDAWLKNVEQADQIVVQDGGSTDGTIDSLLTFQNEHPNMTILLQVESNEKYKWNEQEIRNQCLSLFKTDWILLTDVDELIDDQFWEWAKTTEHDKNGYYIPHRNLWCNWDMFNMDTKWYPDLTMRFFKNGYGFVWVGKEHASVWQLTPEGMKQLQPDDLNMAVIPNDIHIIHYHRVEEGYYDAVMEDKILHHSNEKKNLREPAILTRLIKHPAGAGLIRKRFDVD